MARTKSIISADGSFHQDTSMDKTWTGDALAHQPWQMVPQTRRWKRTRCLALPCLACDSGEVRGKKRDDIKLKNKVRLACEHWCYARYR